MKKLKSLTAGSKLLPDVILLDINMPLINGKELYEELQTEFTWKHIPVMVLTASLNPSDRMYFESRSVEFFEKPDSLAGYDMLIKKVLLNMQ